MSALTKGRIVSRAQKPKKLAEVSKISMDDIDLHPSFGEFTKGLFDHLKHVATLATGSILTVATLLQNVFKQPVANGWVPLAVVLFLICIAASLVAFGVLAITYPRPGFTKKGEAEKNVIATSIMVTWLTFVGGILCVAMFFIANWNALYSK